MNKQKSLLIAIALSCAVDGLRAQVSLGSITGTVNDASGASVSGVQVVVREQSTNAERKTSTRGAGQYQVLDLPIGRYTVTFSKDGFQGETHPDVPLAANRTTTVNGALQVGAISNTVTVSATPLLNQSDATNGYVLDEAAINSIPLGTGSFTQLALLSPGVNADFLGGSGTNSGLGNQSIWANGQRDTSNQITVNGVDVSNIFNGKTSSQVTSNRFTLNTGQRSIPGGDTQTNVSAYNAIGQGLPTPAQETLQQIRVNTSQFDASQGANSGAHIEVVTKSGSNHFHGQLYEFFQTDKWNAASFFRNASPAIPNDQKVAALHYNRFGADLGGPILRNKLFFYFSYQGNRVTDQLGGNSTVTTPLHLTDDRSAAALAQVAATDFKVNLTPSQINPTALKLLNQKVGGKFLIPTPTITDFATARSLGYDAFITAPASTANADQGNINFDYVVNDTNRLAVKYYIQNNPSTNPFARSNLLGFPGALEAGAHTASISDTTVLRPNLTWENKIGFVRQRAFAKTGQEFSNSDIGLNLFGLQNVPGFSITTSDPALNRGLSFGPTSNFSNAGPFQNRWQFTSNVNWVVGKHTLYAGVDYSYTQLNIINRNNQVASITSNSFSDLLQGIINTPNTRFYNGSSNRYYRADQLGTFVQDNWRVSSELTVNLGVRFDWDGGLREKYGLLTNFYPNLYKYDAASDTVTDSGFRIAGNNKQFGDKNTPDTTLNGRQWGFAPRIGVAYSPKRLKNVTFRAGYGIYYDRGEFFTELSPGAGRGFSGPFGVTLQLPFTVQIAGSPSGTLDSPFGTVAPAAPSDPKALSRQLPNVAQLKAGATPYLFGGYAQNNDLPYTQNWSFDVQWQPINNWVATLGYVGNHSANQVLPIPFNQPRIATPSNPINGEIYSYGFNITPTERIRTSEGGNTDIRVPYLGLSTNSVLYEAIGRANYHSLQASLKKRLSQGLQFGTSYTWSHALDEQSALGLFFNGNNPLTPDTSYGTSGYDRTHVFSGFYSYDVPTVRGVNGLLSRLVSGWGIKGVTTAQSGQPFNAYDFSGAVAGQYYSNTVNISDPILPLVPGVKNNQAIAQGQTGVNPNKPYLNASAFQTDPRLYALAPGTNGVPPCEIVNGNQVCDNVETQFGATGRNTFRGPFQLRTDLAVSKETKINERFVLSYRCDFYNVFNQTSFDVPNISTSFYRVSNGAVTLNSPGTFGFISRTLGSPRFLQMTLKLQF